MTDRVYLDWNATAPLRPAARDAMVAALGACGNASSLHGEGRAARALIERARSEVATSVGAAPANVTFTSGGTEANALALSPGWQRGRGPRCDVLITSAIEHPSVLSGGRFETDQRLHVDVNVNGIICLDSLARALQAARRIGARPLVSLMLANNESGALQPVAEAAALVHAAGGLLHVDAVQALGRIPIDINALGADLMTLSAHKVGGPQGVGALVRRDEALHPAKPLIAGGGQERGYRAGTENVTAIAGFGAAAAAIGYDIAAEIARLSRLQEKLETGLCNAVSDAVIFADGARRLPNTTLVSVPGTKAETLLIALDLAGIAVSAGSACSSGKIASSHVLAAMGVEKGLAAGAIRVSTGYATEQSDVERFLLAWRKCIAALRKGHEIAA